MVHKYQRPDAHTTDPLARDRQYLIDGNTEVVAVDVGVRERANEDQALVCAFKIEYKQFHRRILPFALAIEEVRKNATHMALPYVVAHAPEVGSDVKICKEFLEGVFLKTEAFALTRHRDRPEEEIEYAVAGFYCGDSYYLLWTRGAVIGEFLKRYRKRSNA